MGMMTAREPSQNQRRLRKISIFRGLRPNDRNRIENFQSPFRGQDSLGPGPVIVLTTVLNNNDFCCTMISCDSSLRNCLDQRQACCSGCFEALSLLRRGGVAPCLETRSASGIAN
jgi:hypothetical protein